MAFLNFEQRNGAEKGLELSLTREQDSHVESLVETYFVSLLVALFFFAATVNPSLFTKEVPDLFFQKRDEIQSFWAKKERQKIAKRETEFFWSSLFWV